MSTNPPTTTFNPFPALESELTSHFYYTTAPKNYLIQLYVLSAIQGTLLVLNLISLIARVMRKKNSFWMFKLRSASIGQRSFIVPASAVCFLVFHTIFVGVIQGYIWSARNFAIPGSNITGTLYWKTVAFIPLWFAGWSMAWSISISPIFVRQTDYTSSIFDPSRHPLIINTFFILVPILFTVTLFPMSAIVDHTFNSSYKVYLLTLSALKVASNELERGIVPNIEILGVYQVKLSDFTYKIANQWAQTWIVATVFNLIFVMVFVSAVVIQFSALNVGMKRHRFNSNSKNAMLDDQNIKWAYRSLLFTTVVTCIWGTSYAVVGCILAVDALQIFEVGLISVTLELTVLYIASTIGSLISLILFYRSFSSSLISNTSTSIPIATSKISNSDDRTGMESRNHFAFDRQIAIVTEPTAFELDLVRKKGSEPFEDAGTWDEMNRLEKT